MLSPAGYLTCHSYAGDRQTGVCNLQGNPLGICAV